MSKTKKKKKSKSLYLNCLNGQEGRVSEGVKNFRIQKAKVKQIKDEMSKIGKQKGKRSREFKRKAVEYSTEMSQMISMKKRDPSTKDTRSVKVTDHAIVRFLEREKGLDIESVCREMVPQEVIDAIRKSKGNLHDKDPFINYGLIIEGNRIVTFITEETHVEPHILVRKDLFEKKGKSFMSKLMGILKKRPRKKRVPGIEEAKARALREREEEVLEVLEIESDIKEKEWEDSLTFMDKAKAFAGFLYYETFGKR